MEKTEYHPSKPLLGTEEASIDDKGRVILAKKKRERLGATFTMAIGQKGCIVIYPTPVWEKILSSVQQYDVLDTGREDFARQLAGSAEDELECDVQGRVVIPARMRKQAHINDKVYVIGAIDRIEIWAIKEHEKYVADPEGYEASRVKAIDSAKKAMREAGRGLVAEGE